MGNCMNKKGIGKPLTLAILGLDNAGKTVTTKGLQGEPLDDVTPTVGFSNAEFRFNDYDITMYDLGGGKKIRDIWTSYFAQIYGLVYVVDSSEKDRVDECRSVLENLLGNPQIQGKPMLLLANKQDIQGALDEMDICEYLGLEEMVNKFKTPCRVEPCSAIMGQGKKLDKSIKNGIAWLVAMIEKEWDTLKVRVDADTKEKNAKDEIKKRERAERVRKIREERERREKEERLARGEAEKPESEDEGMMEGGPFKPLDYDQLDKKEKREKEEKKKKKEYEKALRASSKSKDLSPVMHNRHIGGGSPHSDDEQDKHSITPPIPSQKSARSLPPLNSSDNAYSKGRTAQGRLGQYDSPRPNRRLVASGNDGSDDEVTASSLHRPPWYQSSLESSELPSQKSSSLAPLRKTYGDDMDIPSRKGVLPSLAPLQPLEDLEKKKKKKKAKKNQTAPDMSDSLQSEDHSWSVAAPRASRSPRLDTVEEPENESDQGVSNFSNKYNLIDELPELPTSRSQYSSRSRRGPNTDYEEDILT